MTASIKPEPAGVTLVACRRLKHHGEVVQAEETFVVDSPAMALKLIDAKYAVASPESVEAVERQHERQSNERARRADRPANPIPAPRPVDAPEPRPRTILQAATDYSALSHPGLARALQLAEDRIARLERVCAPLFDDDQPEAEPIVDTDAIAAREM